MASRSDRQPLTRWDAAIGTVLIVAIWLGTHGYRGIIHDSRLYTLQALARIDPGQFGTDLFLAFGSQDRFTLFSPIYARFITLFGIGQGNMVLLLVCSALWLSGLGWLATGWFQDRRAALVASALAVLLPGGLIFVYGEVFLTPRLAAEGITMAAIGCIVRKRPGVAVLLLGIAGSLHPLTTLPGVALLFINENRHRRWPWIAAFAVATGALVLGAIGISPFTRLVQRFDSAWLAIAMERNSYCFIANWTAREWLAAASSFAVAAVALRQGSAQQRPLLVMAMAIAAAGIAIGFVGGDVLHNVLIVDIQLWRATWLLAVLSHLALAPLLLGRPWRLQETLFAALMALGLLSRFVPVFSALVLPAAALAFFADDIARPTARLLRLALLVVVMFVASALLSGGPALAIADPADASALLIGLGIAASACVLLAALVTTRSSQTAMAVAAVAILAIGAGQWDNRSPWRAFIDTAAGPPQSLAAMLPDSGDIYWDGDVTALWFMVRRPSHFSCAQGAGVLFSRDTALAWRARRDNIARLHGLDFQRFGFCPLPAHMPVRASAADLAQVCRSAPGLGAIVLARPVAGTRPRQWQAPVVFRDIATSGPSPHAAITSTFSIYDCTPYR